MQRTQQQQTLSHATPARPQRSTTEQQTTVMETAASNQLRQRVASDAQRPVVERDSAYELEAESAALQSEQLGDARTPAVTNIVSPAPLPTADDAPAEQETEEFQPEDHSRELSFAGVGGVALPGDPNDPQGRRRISSDQAVRLGLLLRGGNPLQDALRQEMETYFRHDFSAVRIHTTASAHRLAHELGMSAFAAGRHIVFGRGNYQPDTPAGRRLLIHELTHVVQQQAFGSQSMIIQGQGSGNSGNLPTGGGAPGSSPRASIETPPGAPPRIRLPVLRVPSFKVDAHRDALGRGQIYRDHLYTPTPRPNNQADLWDAAVAPGSTIDNLRKTPDGTTLLIDQQPYLLDSIQTARARERARPANDEKMIARHYFGDGPMMSERMKRPNWSSSGQLRPHDVDHRVELQVSGYPTTPWAHNLDNMELLDTSNNRLSGPAIDRDIRDQVQRLVINDPAVHGQLPESHRGLDAQQLMNTYDLYFEAIAELPNVGDHFLSRWSRDEIDRGQHVVGMAANWRLHNETDPAREMRLYDIYDQNPQAAGRWPFNPHSENPPPGVRALVPAAYTGSSTQFVVYHQQGLARTSIFEMGEDRVRRIPETGVARNFVQGALARMVTFYRAAGSNDRLGDVYVERTLDNAVLTEDQRFEYELQVPRYAYFSNFSLAGFMENNRNLRGNTPDEALLRQSPPLGTGLRYRGQNADLTYAYFSPVYLDSLAIMQEDGELNLVQQGYIVPSRDAQGGSGVGAGIISTIFAAGAAIPIYIKGNDINAYRGFEARDFNMPGPVTISAVSLMVGHNPEDGFVVAGQLDFGVGDFATGYLRAAGGEGFRLTGFINFDTRYFEQASIKIDYYDGQISGEGTIVFGDNLLPGVKSGTVIVSYSNAGLEINGMAELDIPGIRQASLRVGYSEADGLTIGGSVFIENVHFISEGYLDLELNIDNGDWKLKGEGNANLDIPGTESAVVDASYDDGYFHIYSEVVTRQFLFKAGQTDLLLQGGIRFGVTNKPVINVGGNTPSSEDTAGEPDKTLRYWGGASIDVIVGDWLHGTATLNFTEAGEIEFLGLIQILSNVDLMDRKSLGPYDVIPEDSVEQHEVVFVGGIPIPIGGFFEYHLVANAFYGPAGLRNMLLSVRYSSANPETSRVEGSADLFMEFGASLVFTGAIGLYAGVMEEIASAGVRIELTEVSANLLGEASLKMIAGINPFVRNAGETFSLDFQPEFKGTITGRIDLSVESWITVIPPFSGTLPIIDPDVYEFPIASFGSNLGLKTKSAKPFMEEDGIDIGQSDLEYENLPDSEGEIRELGDYIYSFVDEEVPDIPGNERSDPTEFQPSTDTSAEIDQAREQARQEETTLRDEAEIDRQRRIAAGEVILGPGDVPPAQASPLFTVYAPGSPSTPLATYDFTAQGGSGQLEFARDRQIPGFEVRRVTYNPAGRGTDLGYLVGVPFGTMRGSVLSPPGDTITLNVTRRAADPVSSDYEAGVIQSSDIPLFPLTVDKLGPINLNMVSIDEFGMLGSGMVNPTAPLLRADLPISLQGDTLSINTTVVGAASFYLPTATIGDPANMHIAFDQSGTFTLDDGLIVFTIPGFADGEIRAPGGQQPEFSLPGQLSLDNKVFDPAAIPLTLDNDGPAANGIVRLKAEDIPDISSGELIVDYDDSGLEALGAADIAVPFAVSSAVDMDYSPTDEGLQFTGSLELDGSQIPGIDSGNLDIDTLWRKGRPLQLTGSGLAQPNIPGVQLPQTMRVHYEAGTLMISGVLSYRWGAVGGLIDVVVINRPVDSRGNTSGPPDDQMRIAIHDPEGLYVVVYPWLNGVTHLNVPGRTLTDMGGLASPIRQSDFNPVIPRRPIEFSVARRPANTAYEPMVTTVYSEYFGWEAINWYAELNIDPPRGLQPDIRIRYNPDEEASSGVEGSVELVIPFTVDSFPLGLTRTIYDTLSEDTLELVGERATYPYPGSAYATTQNFNILWTVNDYRPPNPSPSATPRPTSPVIVREFHTHTIYLPVSLILPPIPIVDEHEVDPHAIHTPNLGWEGSWVYGNQGSSYPITLDDVTIRLLP